LVGLSQGIFTNAQNLSWAIKINPIIHKLHEGVGGIINPQMDRGGEMSQGKNREGQSRSDPA
ncbi:MAG: hypothetical protein KAJ09_14155, partial [Deltaproteobacteria bacterium]|nr:hypothetical protein [Deltaproteobacteria bacterium]